MPNSYTQIETPSTRGPHAFTFDFLDVNDIKAKGLNQQDEWNDLSIESIDKTAKTIILDNTASGLQALRIYRTTTTEELVDFVAGARIREQDLDMAYRQGLFACQEVTEDAQAIGTRITAGSFANSTVDTDVLADDAVISSKIADNAVANNHLNDGSVGEYELINGSVTAAKLASTLDLSNKTLTLPASAIPSISVAVLRDEKTNGTAGGDFLTGAWRTRDLNAETDPDNIVLSLSNNQFTLGAGTYNIYFTAPAFKVRTHHTRLYNVTDNTVAGNGSNAVQNVGAEDSNHSMGCALVTITSNKTFELQHICQTSKTNNGFGVGQAGITGNVGLVETYSIVNITKIA